MHAQTLLPPNPNGESKIIKIGNNKALLAQTM